MQKIILIDEYKIVNYAGGIERVLCNFANEFTKRGYDITIVCLDIEKGKPLFKLSDEVNFINLAYFEKSYKGIEYYLVKIEKELLKFFKGKEYVNRAGIDKDPKKKYFYSQFIQRLAKVILQIQPDIIVSASIDSGYIAQKACNYSIPVIMMCHMNPQIIIDEGQDYQREAWKNAFAVQTLFESYSKLMRNAGANNVVTIPNIVSQIKKDSFYEIKKDEKIYRIITVGRVEQVLKRTHLLVDAFCKIANKYPNWYCDIYGEIDNRNYFKKINETIKKHNLNKRIVLHGKTNNVINKLRESDIFAFPSKSEGFPLAMTEAMSVGLPVIGYKNCSGVNEIIINGENGLLADDGVDDFANKLSYLIENEELRIKFGEEGRKTILQYAPDLIWDKWEILLKSIDNNKGK